MRIVKMILAAMFILTGITAYADAVPYKVISGDMLEIAGYSEKKNTDDNLMNPTGMSRFYKYLVKNNDKYEYNLINLETGEFINLNDSVKDILKLGNSSSGELAWTGNGYFVYHPRWGYRLLSSIAGGQYEYPISGKIYSISEDFSEIYGEYTTPGTVNKAAYVDGIYYILIPINGQYSSALYYSNDLTNWVKYSDTNNIPISYANAAKGIFPCYINNSIVNGDYDITAYNIYSIKNGYISNEIIYENFKGAEIFGCDQYLFTYSNNTLYCSKDGVYWAAIEISDEAAVNAKSATDIYCYKENDIVLQTKQWVDINSSSDQSQKSTSIAIVLDKKQLYSYIEEQLKNKDYYVQFNDKILGFETPPIIENDRTLVPMRFLFEQMGAEVDWNAETKTATATLGNTAVTFAIDNTNAEVNGRTVTTDVPARLVNGKTMVPLRFLSEELGFTVNWDEETRTAVIE